MLFLKIIIISAFLYLLTYLLGCGLATLLLKDKSERVFYYAPWIGLSQTSILLIAFGLLGYGAELSMKVAFAVSILLLLFSLADPDAIRKKLYLPRLKILTSVVAACVLLMAPVLLKSQRLTSFTIGNNDIFDYVLTSRYLIDHGLKSHLRTFGAQPADKDASVEERVVSWQIPAPRWGSYYFLSLLGACFRFEIPDIFSLYELFILALFIPVLWQLAHETFRLRSHALVFGLALLFINPHIIYIAYHGFLPQIEATGFFIGFLSLFPDYVEKENISIGDVLLPALFLAGMLFSYLELFTFALMAITLYMAWDGVRTKTVLSNFKKWACLMVAVSLLAPYQIKQLLSILKFHTDGSGGWGGWDVTQHYFGVMFPLGAFFASPYHMEPSLILELAAGPLVLLLVILGIRHSWRGAFLACIIIPFILSGTICFANDWKYRFYKNFTYVYFWLPLAIASAFSNLEFWEQSVLHRRLHAFAKYLVSAIIVLAASRSIYGMKASVGLSQLVPNQMIAFESINLDPGVKDIYLTGLGFWESMWGSYYFRKKNVVMNEFNRYIRNETASLSDPRYKWVFTKEENAENMQKISGRTIKTVAHKLAPYALYQLN